FVKSTISAVPFLLGPILTFVAALTAASTQGDGASWLPSTFGGVAVAGMILGSLIVGSYMYFALGAWQRITATYLERVSKRLASGDLTWKVNVITAPGKAQLEGAMVNNALAKIHQNFSKVVRQA